MSASCCTRRVLWVTRFGQTLLEEHVASLRLTAWFSAIFLGGFALFGVVKWLDLAYSVGQGRDRTLTRRASRISELLDATSGDPHSAREARFEQLFCNAE